MITKAACVKAHAGVRRGLVSHVPYRPSDASGGRKIARELDA